MLLAFKIFFICLKKIFLNFYLLPLIKDSFIIDNGKAGIWVWIGRKSGIKERQEAMRNALVTYLSIFPAFYKQTHSIVISVFSKGFLASERLR